MLDRFKDSSQHLKVTQQIKEKSLPSLLFIDKDADVTVEEKSIYTHVIDKNSDFILIKDRIDDMLKTKAQR